MNASVEDYRSRYQEAMSFGWPQQWISRVYPSMRKIGDVLDKTPYELYMAAKSDNSPIMPSKVSYILECAIEALGKKSCLYKHGRQKITREFIEEKMFSPDCKGRLSEIMVALENLPPEYFHLGFYDSFRKKLEENIDALVKARPADEIPYVSDFVLSAKEPPATAVPDTKMVFMRSEVAAALELPQARLKTCLRNRLDGHDRKKTPAEIE